MYLEPSLHSSRADRPSEWGIPGPSRDGHLSMFRGMSPTARRALWAPRSWPSGGFPAQSRAKGGLGVGRRLGDRPSRWQGPRCWSAASGCRAEGQPLAFLRGSEEEVRGSPQGHCRLLSSGFQDRRAGRGPPGLPVLLVCAERPGKGGWLFDRCLSSTPSPVSAWARPGSGRGRPRAPSVCVLCPSPLPAVFCRVPVFTVCACLLVSMQGPPSAEDPPK